MICSTLRFIRDVDFGDFYWHIVKAKMNQKECYLNVIRGEKTTFEEMGKMRYFFSQDTHIRHRNVDMNKSVRRPSGDSITSIDTIKKTDTSVGMRKI